MYKENDLVRVIDSGAHYKKGEVFVVKREWMGQMSGLHIVSKYDEIGLFHIYSSKVEPVTHLTTKEFITLVEDMGYEVEGEGEYRIGVKKDEFSRTLATVGVYNIFELDTISSEFKELQNKELLFKILTLYATTPLELREEKEKLYTLELPNTASCYRYYSRDSYAYLFDDIHDDNGYQNKFTQKEIDELKQGDHGDLIKMLKQEPVK